MSRRPIEQKKRRRVAKALRRSLLPAYIDVVQWLIEHGHAKNRREAREIILAKRVQANSHTLGVGKVNVQTATGIKEQEIVFEHVPAELRPDILVLAEKEDE